VLDVEGWRGDVLAVGLVGALEEILLLLGGSGWLLRFRKRLSIYLV